MPPRRKIDVESVKVFLEVERQIRSLRAALNSWVYGVGVTSLMRTGNMTYAEQVTKEAFKIWIKNVLRWRSDKTTPLEVIRDYINHLDKMLIMKQEDFDLEEKNNKIKVAVRRCIFRDACQWREAEGAPPFCPRAVSLAAAVEVGSTLKKRYVVTSVSRKEKECVAEITPQS